MPSLASLEKQVKFSPDGKEVVVPADLWERVTRALREVEGWKETLHLLESAPNRERLLKAIREVEEGLVTDHELIED